MAPNPFLNSSKPDSGSEQIVQAKSAALDEAVEKAYQIYVGLDYHISYWFYEEELGKLEKQILLPNQIDSLLQVIKSETEPDKLSDRVTGLYLTRLIQDSYDAGNNDFVLTTGDTHIDFLGFLLRGKEKRRLKLRIEGCVGERCGSDTRDINLRIFGNAGRFCVANTGHIKIRVFGSVGDYFGVQSGYSKLNVSEKVGVMPGTFSNNSLFTASKEQTYDMFKEYADCDRGNTIRLVNSKGKVIKEEHL